MLQKRENAERTSYCLVNSHKLPACWALYTQINFIWSSQGYYEIPISQMKELRLGEVICQTSYYGK